MKLLDLEDGLLDVQCFDVYQDTDGYIWIGSRAGLNKYDGRDVKSFNRKNGLLADNIFSIHEDSQKRKWLLNLNGEPLFVKNDIVHNRFTDPYLAKLKSAKFKEQIFENSDGYMVFVHRNGEIKVLEGEVVKSYNISGVFENDNETLYGVIEFDNKYYALLYYGIVVFDKNFENRTIHQRWDIENNIWRKCLHGDILYFSSTIGLMSFDMKTKTLKEIHKFENSKMVTDLRIIHDQLYVSTLHGAFIYNGTQLEEYHPEIKEAISAVVKDDYGNEWFASLSSGIIQWTSTEISSSRYDFIDSISFLSKNGDNEILGTSNGELFIKNGKNLTPHTKTKFVNNGQIIGALELDDVLWAVGADFLYNNNGVKIELYIRDIKYDSSNSRLYVISGNGVRMFPKEFLDNYHELTDSKKADYYEKSYWHNIYQAYKSVISDNSDLWVCAEDGLFKITNESIEKIKNKDVSGSIIDIATDGKLIFGINYGKGVFVYDEALGSSTLFDESNGLLSNNVTNIAIDYPLVYASHSKGISKLIYKDGKLNFIRNFGYAHGMKSGDVTFLTVIDGVPHFGINHKSYEIDDPNDYHDTIHVNGAITKTETYSDEELIITYDCIEYKYGKGLDYQYKLSPIDTVWTTTSSEEISYRYLPTGHYLYEVKAFHPLKIPSKSYEVNFEIKSRWYNSYLTYAIAGLFLFIISWFLVKIDVLNFSSDKLRSWIIDFLGLNKKQQIRVKDVNGGVQLILVENLLFVKASGNYMEYNTSDNKIVTRSTLKKSKSLLNKSKNIHQVHRSYLANLDKVRKITGKSIFLDSQEIPISSTFKENIASYLHKRS